MPHPAASELHPRTPQSEPQPQAYLTLPNPQAWCQISHDHCDHADSLKPLPYAVGVDGMRDLERKTVMLSSRKSGKGGWDLLYERHVMTLRRRK